MLLFSQNGPPQYRSSTVFEDATPEIVRDFFWDDEFRTKNGWDDMLLYHETLEECPRTGTMVVHWVRKVRIRLRSLYLIVMKCCLVLCYGCLILLFCSCSSLFSAVIGSISLVGGYGSRKEHITV